MKALVTLTGGGIAIVLGVVGFAVWYQSFLQILAVLFPVMLLIGSGLAIYVGLAEVKDRQNNT